LFINRYPNAQTYTSQAITKAEHVFFGSDENRRDVPDVLLVFTDGSNTMGVKKLKKAVDLLDKVSK